MKHKKLVTLCVVLLVVAIAGCGWHTRWRKLPEMFQMDIQAETGFVSATSWYPFTENDRNTQYDIDVVYAESEIFKGLTEILDEISVRKTLFSHRSPNTVVGEPSVSITYCRGDRRIWLIFNDRFLKVGEYGDGVGKLYKVKPESGRALSAYITENGYHLQTYLQEMKEDALPAKTYLQKHSSEEILSDFVCATYIPDGFSSVRELSADELLRFGVLVSAQGGMEWYDQTTDQYVIPLMDLQAILDTYFENCRFDPDSLARYASYDEANAVFTAKALGFSTGSAEYTLISAEELDIETVQVVMEDSVTGNLATATAKVTENGVRFLSCIKESAQQDQSEAAILTIDPQLRQLFRSVLRNETSFTFVPSQQTMTLQDFGKKDLMTSFTVLDLEGDGVPELIVQAEGPYYSMILRYDGGLLFGYEIPYRGMMDLKADGTYCFSSGHQDHGIGRASFTEQGMETNKLIWCQSVPTVNDIFPTKCEWFANGKPATEEDLTKAYDSRAYLEDVRWYDYNDEMIDCLFGAVDQTSIPAIRVPYRDNQYIDEEHSSWESFYVAGNHATAIYKCTGDNQQLVYQAEGPSVIRSIQKGKEYVFFQNGPDLYRLSESDGQCNLVMECVHSYFIADNLIYILMDTDFSLRVLDGFEEHLDSEAYIQLCDRVHSVVPTTNGVIYSLGETETRRNEVMVYHKEEGEVQTLDNRNWGSCSFSNGRIVHHHVKNNMDGQYAVTWYDLIKNEMNHGMLLYESKDHGNQDVRMVTVENDAIYLLLYSGEVICAPLGALEEVTYLGRFSLDTYGVLDFGVAGESVYLTAQPYDTGVYQTEIIETGNVETILIE